MAAESPRRSLKAPGAVSRPLPVSDKTVMESVVDFIHDVVPQSYGGSSKSDERDAITWVKFVYADINDPNTYGDDQHHNGNAAPLLIVLGYSNGVQIWTIPANGEAQEVLSWRQGAVRALCVLPTPDPAYNMQDIFYGRRPLVAICDSSSAGQQFCSISFVSLKTGDQVDCIKFKNPVCNIHCNKRVIVVSFQERIAVFDACTFKDKFTISSCYPTSGPNLNPIALGTNWLAYADQKLVSVHQTAGGVAGYGAQSYTATVIHAAKTLTKGLTMFGETVASSLTGSKSVQQQARRDHLSDSSCPQPGIVTIVDLKNVGQGEVNVHEDSDGEGIVAHFVAHANDPVAALQFDFSGILLLTADRLGHNFHLFRILPHPMASSLGAVHHLYTLYRGDTTAKVQDMAFSLDSRWVAVSTLRGTTHIFPITSYGGPVTLRTHASQKVVNRLSRFHKSAGLEDIQPSNTGRNSPVPTGSPSASSVVQPTKGASQGGQSGRAYDSHPSVQNYRSTITGRMGNPRLPPYPHPTVVTPLAQIRQSTPFAGFACSGGTRSPPTKGTKGSAAAAAAANRTASETVNVAAVFAPPRSWLVGSPGGINKDKTDKRCVDSLYVIGCNGTVIEYTLEPHVSASLAKSNEDSAVELDVLPQAQWHLHRSSSSVEVKPPLSSTNALMITQEFISVLRNERSPGLSRPLPVPPVGVRRDGGGSLGGSTSGSESDDSDERWLSQVEIITHAGPHRRLWMGPQFSFKTFQHSANTTILSATSSALLCQSPESSASSAQGMDIFMEEHYLESLGARPTRSTPMAMPSGRHGIPLLIEAGSAGSFEQSPGMFENSWPESGGGGASGGGGGGTGTGTGGHRGHCIERPTEDQLRENLAEAMIESPARVNVCVPCIGHRNVSSSESQGSSEELSTSSSHSGSASHASNSSSARISPPHSDDHVLVFPAGTTTPPASPDGHSNSDRS